MGWLDAIVGLGLGLLKGVVILLVLLFLLERLPLPEPVSLQLHNSIVVSHLERVNPFLAQSVRVYERFGDKHLWERLHVPEPAQSSAMGEGRTVGGGLTQ